VLVLERRRTPVIPTEQRSHNRILCVQAIATIATCNCGPFSLRSLAHAKKSPSTRPVQSAAPQIRPAEPVLADSFTLQAQQLSQCRAVETEDVSIFYTFHFPGGKFVRLRRVEVSYGRHVAYWLAKTCRKLKKCVNVRHCGSFVLSSWPLRLSFPRFSSLNYKHERRLREKITKEAGKQA